MSKSEKSYFKKFCTQTIRKKNQHNYLKLFFAIDQLSEYDETILIKKFRRESFVKNFTETKQYLKKQILNALRNFGIEHSIEFQLGQDILNIQILMDKGIFDLATTQVNKALQTAQKYELLNLILQLSHIKALIPIFKYDYKAMDQADEMYLEQKKTLKKIDNLAFHLSRYTKVFSSWRKGNSLDEKDFFFDHEEYPTDSFRTRSIFLSTKVNLLNLNREKNTLELLYNCVKTHYELYQNNPHQINTKPQRYLSVLCSYANLLTETNRIKDGVNSCIIGIDLLKQSYKNKQISFYFFIYYTIEFSTYQLFLHAKSGSKLLFEEYYYPFKDLVLEYKRHRPLTNSIADLCVVIFAEIMLEKWTEASFSYLQFNQHKKSGLRNDIHIIARLLGIILYYETNQYNLLEVSVNAAYQFVLSKKISSQFAKKFINLFKYKLIPASNPSENIAAFKEFKLEISAYFQHAPQEQTILHYVDFLAWIDSKIELISFYEAYCNRLILPPDHKYL